MKNECQKDHELKIKDIENINGSNEFNKTIIIKIIQQRFTDYNNRCK